MPQDDPLGTPLDDELTVQLGRVRSDLSFRRWARHRIKMVAVLVALDLLASTLSIAAILGVRHIQIESCQRDNTLRAAYVAQWQPVLDQPPAPLTDNPTDADRARYEAGIQTRDRFQKSLETGFKQHPC